MATVTYHWEPDPAIFAEKILAVDASLRDPTPALLASENFVQEDIRDRFLTETAPDGTPWQPWASRYAAYAESFPNEGILRQTKELYDAATDENSFIVSNDTLFYETTMPERGVWHQEGRPGRRTRTGAANPLPARPFLGLSDQTATLIFATFADWFNRSIDLFETTRGRIGRRHSIRGTQGTFIPRSAPMPRRPRLR